MGQKHLKYIRQGDDLTPRELELVALVGEGLTNKAIAARLFISPHTVKTHLARIAMRTGESRREMIVLYCLRRGWIQ